LSKLKQELCIVHLVRAQNGIEPLRQFLESYRANPGGVKHDLLIVLKGFSGPDSIMEYTRLLKSVDHSVINISDEGVDITAYFFVVKQYAKDYKYFCFLNSHSVLLDKDWLKKLYENISKPGIGLVGATGSWESNSSNVYASFRRKVRTLIGIKDRTSSIGMGVRTHLPVDNSFSKAVFGLVRSVWINFQFLIYFKPFPNQHIRTNAFMISGIQMISLEKKKQTVKSKMDAYRFESGKDSLTRRILEKGLKVIVVGKNGIGYEKEKWLDSNTFRASKQENLLVGDNQSRDYQSAPNERQSYLRSITWGKSA
jgi:hypothetical protein